MRRLSETNSLNQRTDILLRKFRSRIDSYPPGMCPLALYRSILHISMSQSCGKCVPCRDGLVQVERLFSDILSGTADEKTLEKMRQLCEMIARTADCVVGVASAMLVLDSLEKFPDEYESHLKYRRCIPQVGQTIPCMTLCPAHVDVPAYIALIKEGDYAGAVNMIRDRNPFPTACAMVCEHPCERKCRRRILDAPVNIRGLKQYAVEQVSADQVATPQPNVNTGKEVAIIGGGPSGLTAAYFLSLMGHKAVVYDEHPQLGGMLRYGIPRYRLPKDRLDQDIHAILNAGNIEVRPETKIGRDISFEEIRQTHDAVYLALGAQLGNRIPVENADAKNVIPAADFLQQIARGEEVDLTGKRVTIIGGGNVAMDAARTAVRLQAESVHVFTRKRDDLTALQGEIDSAAREGVHFRTLVDFLHIEADPKEPDHICAVWLQPEIVAEYDEDGLVTTEHSSRYPYRFKCDYLIMGVGQHSDTDAFEKAGVPVSRSRILADSACMVEGMEGVFSGGDCVSGPSTAINAIAAGQVAAFNIDEYLGYHHKIPCEAAAPPAMPNPFIPTGRTVVEEVDPAESRENFDFVEIPMTPEEALREAGRCLRCDHHGCGSMEGGRFHE